MMMTVKVYRNKDEIDNILQKINENIGVVHSIEKSQVLRDSTMYDTYNVRIIMKSFNFKKECKNYTERGFIKRLEWHLGYEFKLYKYDEYTNTISFAFKNEDESINRWILAEKLDIDSSKITCIKLPVYWIYSIDLNDYMDTFKVRL